MQTLLKKLFPSRNERLLKVLWPQVALINQFEPKISQLSDAELRQKTDEFKSRLAKNESLDALLPEAFAVVREAAKRTVKMRHYDVQLIGGIVLHQGKISEMSTGEGKTLVATLPIYLNALTGKGVHLVTVNDYLAKRDREWMGPIYEFLGLTVGVIQHDMPHQARIAAYRADITYGTNNEFGFDYLRDNMVVELNERVQRGTNYAIVDEVDSILVDEARTPLIISGPAEESTDKYYKIDRIIPKLEAGRHFKKDEKANTSTLTEEGIVRCEELLGIQNLYENTQIDIIHHIHQALKAHNNFRRDVDYMIQDNKVVIVDEFTGRLMPGRRFSDGLHQALEAKENVKIERENQTLATITFQNFFRMYQKLAGMTGTASTEAVEFDKIYKLEVMVIPTNKPCIRQDFPDSVYKTEREKLNAVVEEIARLNEQGRPVLVGTVSIEKSEHISTLLEKRRLAHTVLNAKYHAQEAEIVARAGQPGAITIATNMAGRGTDIVLGEAVAQKGGLHVLGTERHEARRIDNQLRGRCARQGDPGSSKFYLSLEDDLMRIFGSDRIKGLMEKLGMEEGQEIESGLVSRAIETAQKRVETHNFEIRKHLLEFDDVMNRQREIIYAERNKVLLSDDLTNYVFELTEEVVEGMILTHLNPDVREDERNPEAFRDAFRMRFGERFGDIKTGNAQGLISEQEILLDDAVELLKAVYAKKKQEFGASRLLFLERYILLQTIDAKWKDHLRSLDELREGIYLRAYAQTDPLVEYKHEAFRYFDEMIASIKEEAVEFLFKVQAVKEEKMESVLSSGKQQLIHPDAQSMPAAQIQPQPRVEAANRPGMMGRLPPAQDSAKAAGLNEQKVGRNDPCPCGSGKKYKKCHGV